MGSSSSRTMRRITLVVSAAKSRRESPSSATAFASPGSAAPGSMSIVSSTIRESSGFGSSATSRRVVTWGSRENAPTSLTSSSATSASACTSARRSRSSGDTRVDIWAIASRKVAGESSSVLSMGDRSAVGRTARRVARRLEKVVMVGSWGGSERVREGTPNVCRSGDSGTWTEGGKGTRVECRRHRAQLTCASIGKSSGPSWAHTYRNS